MKFVYRKAKTEDLNELMRIYTAAQAFMEANGNPQWGKGFPDENDVIAAVFSAVGYDRDYDDIIGGWLSDGKYLAVHRVASAEKYRGQGAAKFIVNCAANEIAKVRKCKSVRMDTHEKNIPMRSLLTSQGFTECGIITLIRDDSARIAFEKLI